ncbi:ANTAR domain-containing protein [Microlunatus sagamiharensis]|uniref:ANTAR domain-containing protein n=1 Tax=Microlunatus sagamiharensis TaxID=546874 RepID=UPI000B888D27|nr:ANTAR domain-containing protein [Microlunatus sagamiharensis]
MTPSTPDEPGTRHEDDVLLRDALSELERRRTVEIATGVLMWRHGLDADEAWTMLAELADEQGVSVATMAYRLQLPGS